MGNDTIQIGGSMGKEKSSWDTETGLLDDYDFDVEEAWFGEDEEADSNDGRIFLFLRGTATDDEGEEHEEHRERYSTGKNWEAVEDGAEVENATGKHRFNQNAGLGRLINALVGLGEDEAVFLSKRGQAYEASTFDGLNMHMEAKVVSTWTNDDGEEVSWTLTLPTALTMPKKKKAKKGGKGKASRSAAKKPTKVSGLQAEITEFASQFNADEHDEFVDQVLDEDVFDNANKIMDDDELHAEVLDPDSDLWAKAH
jgi:hypothetical protein